MLTVAGLLALVGTSAEVRSWNDASRLATVESLARRGTWVIDDSPYTAQTCDKLFIAGHFYSDKSPVPALPLAALARLTDALGLPFAWSICFASAGLAYVFAVWCVWLMGRPLGLTPQSRLVLTAAFALATVALPYGRMVNNHVLLLVVMAAIWLQLAWLTRDPSEATPGRFALLGLLAGLAYTIDLGAGPPLAALTGLLLLCRGSPRLVALFVVCAIPLVALHHGVNYAIAGTWKPANAVPENLAWPGSPFHAGNMSGVWNHAGPGAFLLYAADLLVGKKGFLLHNLPLLALVWLRPGRRIEAWTALAMGAGVWLVYAAGSTNWSGACLTIRWFVPLLAPSFFLIALVLRDSPQATGDLAILSVGGAVLCGLGAWAGPWSERMVPGFWVIVAVTVLAWLRHRFSTGTGAGNRPPVEGSPAPDTAEFPAAA